LHSTEKLATMTELIVLHELKQLSIDKNNNNDKYQRYSEQLLALLSDQWPRQASTGNQMLAQVRTHVVSLI
jgi:hypothetical protein